MMSLLEFFIACAILGLGAHSIGVYAKSEKLGRGIFFVGVGLIGGMMATAMWVVQNLSH